MDKFLPCVSNAITDLGSEVSSIVNSGLDASLAVFGAREEGLGSRPKLPYFDHWKQERGLSSEGPRVKDPGEVLGLSLRRARVNGKTMGMEVMAIDPESEAAEVGIQKGDMLLRIGLIEVRGLSESEFEELLLHTISLGEKLRLAFVRPPPPSEATGRIRWTEGELFDVILESCTQQHPSELQGTGAQESEHQLPYYGSWLQGNSKNLQALEARSPKLGTL
mmetsp:Transcript_49382/g.77166  ORF Transcript_49382/g.77166 Transcript_49382/m.77166 type:complete len:221 (-) Transcript_49382:95-757(-)|eukprot:CAMPEP_0184297772 /NCGR_PEP_ID=MMETSP1049-20130417/8658_1 /TAXON_ID=77928 /ORGANISM="Proteomonas sulcata, Strain CCMP704" /LENGTH=220 /DNA_ID=CAMNT_0026607653 /DNA_START=29 /DNA_END=691 /DNA_ORIENTATION=+